MLSRFPAGQLSCICSESLMESNCERSRHLFIPQLHNSLAMLKATVQASGAFRTCRARAVTCVVEQ